MSDTSTDSNSVAARRQRVESLREQIEAEQLRIAATTADAESGLQETLLEREEKSLEEQLAELRRQGAAAVARAAAAAGEVSDPTADPIVAPAQTPPPEEPPALPEAVAEATAEAPAPEATGPKSQRRGGAAQPTPSSEGTSNGGGN